MPRKKGTKVQDYKSIFHLFFIHYKLIPQSIKYLCLFNMSSICNLIFLIQVQRFWRMHEPDAKHWTCSCCRTMEQLLGLLVRTTNRRYISSTYIQVELKLFFILFLFRLAFKDPKIMLSG